MITRPAVFDSFAAGYDHEFTHSPLAQMLRPRVWAKLIANFSAGQHVLELACGTGEDAVWLARQGVRVTATDGSPEMVKVARAKAERAGMSEHVAVKTVSLQAMAEGNLLEALSGKGALAHDEKFDGVFSNFGGLNTIGAWQPLAEALAGVVRPGGKVVLVPMGPVCLWEMLWYLVHGQPRPAFRRLRQPATAKIGKTVIPIWYPSARRLQTDFGPWFRHLSTESLGLWLPPSYLDHWVERWPALFARLNRLEATTAHLTASWGDHYVIVFERR